MLIIYCPATAFRFTWGKTLSLYLTRLELQDAEGSFLVRSIVTIECMMSTDNLT
jgi:hypothetical protein